MRLWGDLFDIRVSNLNKYEFITRIEFNLVQFGLSLYFKPNLVEFSKSNVLSPKPKPEQPD